MCLICFKNRLTFDFHQVAKIQTKNEINFRSIKDESALCRLVSISHFRIDLHGGIALKIELFNGT